MDKIVLKILLPRGMSQREMCQLFLELERVIGAFHAFGMVE